MSSPQLPLGPLPSIPAPPPTLAPIPSNSVTSTSFTATMPSIPAQSSAAANTNSLDSLPKVEKLCDGNWLAWKLHEIYYALSNQSPPPVLLVLTPLPTATLPLPFIPCFPRRKILHNGNWPVWKKHMTTTLKQIKAYDIVTGTLISPQDPVAAADWWTKDLTTQLLITTTMEDEQIIHVSECKSSSGCGSMSYTILMASSPSYLPKRIVPAIMIYGAITHTIPIKEKGGLQNLDRTTRNPRLKERHMRM